MQRTGTHGRRLIAALPVIVLILLILVDQLTKLYFHLYGVKGKDITVIPEFFLSELFHQYGRGVREPLG